MRTAIPETLRTMTALIVAMCSLVMLSGCGAGTQSDQASAIGPKIHVGIVSDEPGISFIKSADYQGLDIEVARYVIHELGFVSTQIVWKPVEPKDRVNVLDRGEADLVLGSFSITDQRKTQVDFAGPYFIAGQDLLVRKETSSITGVQTLAQAKVCTVADSNSSAVIRVRAPQAQLVEEKSLGVCATALLTGEVDALSADDFALAGLVQTRGGGQLRRLNAPFTYEHYGLAVRHGQPQLVASINDALGKMIKDGSWQSAVNRAAASIHYRPDLKLSKPTALDASPSRLTR